MARVLEVCDTLVAAGDRFLKGCAPASKCERAYYPNVTDSIFETWKASNKAFHVFVMPLRYASATETRRHDRNTYTYGIVAIDRYTAAAGPAPTAWIDSRIKLFEDFIQEVSEFRDPLEGSGKTDGPRCTSEDVSSILDIPLLVERDVFWAEAELEFQEVLP
jgi:hypothetical protein